MKRRIVIKIGSNVLTREDGKLDVTRMSALVDQVAWLRKHGIEVISLAQKARHRGHSRVIRSRGVWTT